MPDIRSLLLVALLAGCSVRWTSVPFLDYDCTFQGLENPPLFRFEGPDGSAVRVVLDAWASRKANYRQGGYLLEDTQRVTTVRGGQTRALNHGCASPARPGDGSCRGDRGWRR